MSNAQEKANLARIRDNQRRSRARRKEYLEELEARLRQCELQGIEASAEIQMAARRVADENKKLRSLLHTNGIAEDRIQAFLQSSESIPAGRYGKIGAAGQHLDQILVTRKNVCALGCGTPSSLTQRADSRSSSANLSTMQPLWDGQSQQMQSQDASSAQQCIAPGSVTSRRSSVNVGYNSNHSRPASVSSLPHIQPGRVASTVPIHNSGSIINGHATQNDIDPQFNFLDISSSTTPAHQVLQQQNPSCWPSSMYMPPSTPNVNSCAFVTDMIASMGSADPQVIRAELGCMPNVDCNVDNQLVFNVMDRYTGAYGI